MANVTYASSLKVVNDNARIRLCLAGEAIAVGDNCRQSGSSFVKVVNNGTLAQSTGTLLAITAAALGENFVGVLPGSEVESTGAFVQGQVYVASDTAGATAPAGDPITGRRMAIVGYGKTANILIYQPLGVDTTYP